MGRTVDLCLTPGPISDTQSASEPYFSYRELRLRLANRPLHRFKRHPLKIGLYSPSVWRCYLYQTASQARLTQSRLRGHTLQNKTSEERVRKLNCISHKYLSTFRPKAKRASKSLCSLPKEQEGKKKEERIEQTRYLKAKDAPRPPRRFMPRHPAAFFCPATGLFAFTQSGPRWRMPGNSLTKIANRKCCFTFLDQGEKGAFRQSIRAAILWLWGVWGAHNA